MTNREQIIAQYEKADIGKRMGFGKRPCILVVDFQHRHLRLSHGHPVAR